ncbi:MAG: nucleotidyl transferase AbiEii/AbiGii toxin family protein [Clostridiaceae bacterium]|nr:nucleotidyl transferase AbiEii/AbiGii toxin family protein [Clostridiaceae bacterium]
MMESIESIRIFFPPVIAQNKAFDPMILKEYIQCQTLEFLSRQPDAARMTFIGGTCLRLVHGINRFSEDLDFDCKNLDHTQFHHLTDNLLVYLGKCGYKVEAKDKESDKLTAFRRSIYFPELLYSLHLTGFREQRFLLKIETQDQEIEYPSETVFLNRCGFLFPLKFAPISILCAMKVMAVLNRGKGRDFYDLMFLLQRTEPDYGFLEQKNGICNKAQLIAELIKKVASIDLSHKCRDFEHLLIEKSEAAKILRFGDLVKNL